MDVLSVLLSIHDSLSMLLLIKSIHIDTRGAMHSNEFNDVRSQQFTGSWNLQACPDKILYPPKPKREVSDR